MAQMSFNFGGKRAKRKNTSGINRRTGKLLKGYKYGTGGKVVKVASKASKKPITTCSGAGYNLSKSKSKGIKSASGRKLARCK